MAGRLNVSDVFDWNFYWQMFRNFTATLAPFVMVPVAILSAGLLIGVIIYAVRAARAS